MGRGRQSRELVAKRVRDAKNLEAYRKTLSATEIANETSDSPSKVFNSFGGYMTNGIFQGMKEADRRIRLKYAANRRRARAGIRQKQKALILKNETLRDREIVAYQRLKMRIRIGERQDILYGHPSYGYVIFDEFIE